MSILVSGANGAGKTNYLLAHAVSVAVENYKAGDARTFYYYSIKGFNGDKINQDNDVEIDFQELAPEDFLDIEARIGKDMPSILFIDEVQQVFRKAEVDQFCRKNNFSVHPFIAWFETHRHGGNDCFFTLQHPRQLHEGIKDVIDRYYHIVNVGGLRRNLFKWSEYKLPSDSAKNSADRETIKLNKQCFTWYESTVQNNRKLIIPNAAKKAVIVCLVSLLGVYFVTNRYSDDEIEVTSEQKITEKDAQAIAMIKAENKLANVQRINAWSNKSVREKRLDLVPVLPLQQVTAPVYKGSIVAPRPNPFGGCIKSGLSCVCFDTKGNILNATYDQCVAKVKARFSVQYSVPDFVYRDDEELKNEDFGLDTKHDFAIPSNETLSKASYYSVSAPDDFNHVGIKQ